MASLTSLAYQPRVAYYYDAECTLAHYGPIHPMKPHRMKMAHSLITSYGLHHTMTTLRPRRATHKEMTRFHGDDYIKFLRLVSPKTMMDHQAQLARFNVGEDCPVFDGLYTFSQISAGGSIDGAIRLNRGHSDIAINWAGGLHHAKRSEASGFCYVNDIVLGILELLKYHRRVLYIDIDVHAGDGTEEAFYTTDRVMTVSFHKYGDFFPGTGDVRDIGAGRGKNHALNFPLNDGIDDETFTRLFRDIIGKVMENYRPEAIVLQCGADSLTGDRLGCFNLTTRGHGACVSFVKSFNVPTLILGGGGYTIRNVARCWAYETSLVVGAELPDELPYNEYYEYYGPEYRLHIAPSNMQNLNDPGTLERNREMLLEQLRTLGGPPNAVMESVPPDLRDISDDEDEDLRDPDVRPGGVTDLAKRPRHPGCLSDSEEEDAPKPRRDRTAHGGPGANGSTSGAAGNATNEANANGGAQGEGESADDQETADQGNKQQPDAKGKAKAARGKKQ